MAIPSLSLRASVRLPYHVSSPRSPNRTCGFPASRLSSGIMRLAHRSRSHPWTTPMGLALVPDSIHCRSQVAARPIDALTTPSSSDDPFTFACDASGVSGPLPGFQAFATPGTLPPSVTAPHLRPLPSTGITRLLQYYRPLRHPGGPRLTLASFRFGACLTTHRASHVATFFPFHACQRHYPGGSRGVPASLASPSVFGLPHFSGGSAPALPVRGLLDVHSRSGPHVR